MPTGIEWTDETWNPVRGCSRVSEGCRNCYAERVAARFSQPGQPYEGLARFTLNGPRWTGEVRVDNDALQKPKGWVKPRMVFVNSMSDLFHKSLHDSDIIRVFSVMQFCSPHTFQVLTKRPHRMRGFCRDWFPRPLKNVWLGVSVEDRVTAEERIPLLQATPAAVRFVSCEPLLGHIPVLPLSGIDWVIVGAESGPDARPMNIDWVKSIVNRCREDCVTVFVKQICENGRKIPFDEWPKDLQVRQWPKALT